jgi:RNA polymerase sigma-70 factor (ECF subfamily)
VEKPTAAGDDGLGESLYSLARRLRPRTVVGVSPSTGPLGASRFHTTRWSVVLAAGGAHGDTPAALEQLCATYWRPVYAFLRRRGHDVDEARDLTQGFFADFLERRDVERVDPARGRFRAYLLTSVKHFVGHARERARALKRGGGAPPLSLSFADDDDSSLGLDPADPRRTPEADYERQWALALLRRALERLRAEQADRRELFERLKPTLAGESVAGGYASVAGDLGLTTVAVKVTAHRLKKRYGELLLEEVARTVDTPQEIEDELQHLFRALEG